MGIVDFKSFHLLKDLLLDDEHSKKLPLSRNSAKYLTNCITDLAASLVIRSEATFTDCCVRLFVRKFVCPTVWHLARCVPIAPQSTWFTCFDCSGGASLISSGVALTGEYYLYKKWPHMEKIRTDERADRFNPNLTQRTALIFEARWRCGARITLRGRSSWLYAAATTTSGTTRKSSKSSSYLEKSSKIRWRNYFVRCGQLDRRDYEECK